MLKSPEINARKSIKWNAFQFLMRFVPACIIVIAVFYLAGPSYIRLFLPVFAGELEFLHPEYSVVDYEIVNIGQVDYLQYDIKVNKRMPADQGDAEGMHKVTQHKGQASSLCIAPIIMISLILSWPGLSIRRRLQTFVLSIPLVVLIECLDYPMIFIANIESIYSPSTFTTMIRTIWFHILGNGGRQFMALMGFGLLVAPYHLKFEKLEMQKATHSVKSIGRNAPCPCGSGKKYKNCCLNSTRP